ncbi:lysoplasmalogenase family protein [Gordonia sp. (in: high G+C Gram-positive bacteria)]|uniref:lysoplasmalogenase family protein n=1 Tax=Gordonia sp. (in: high G+C Gram-positive bacteria) TaxID=84139 RepID=UPI0039E2EB3E
MPKGWLAATAAAGLAATAAGAAHNRRLAALTKPIPMALLAARVATDRRTAPLDRALVLGAIGFSMAGDHWMLREEFASAESASKNALLRRGAALFAGAQLCYQAAFARRGARFRLRAFAPRMAAMGEPAVVLAANAPSVLPVLGPYGALLAGMSTMAADDGTTAAAGGLLFQASDIAIINRRHLVHSPALRAGAEAWVLGSYFGAQYLLVDALLQPR